jgi:hypothetical protein
LLGPQDCLWVLSEGSSFWQITCVVQMVVYFKLIPHSSLYSHLGSTSQWFEAAVGYGNWSENPEYKNTQLGKPKGGEQGDNGGPRC